MAPSRSAALAGLYSTSSRRTSASRSNPHFYALPHEDIHLLADIFQDLPTPELQTRIRDLPRNLRASGFHRSPSASTGKVHPGYLCDVHKKLKKSVSYEVLSLLQREIMRIAKFLYPVIMSGHLVAWEEDRMRQLEAVPQMYIPGYDAQACAPEGRLPVCPGSISEKGIFVPRWAYEESQCPACILARIGADEAVLFALLAGEVACVSRRDRGSIGNPKSRRVRLLKDWLEMREGGERLVNDAFYLAGRMRDIKRDLRRRASEERSMERAKEMQAGHDIRAETSSHRGVDRSDGQVPHDAADATGYRQSVIGVDISEPYAPQHVHNVTVESTRPASQAAAGATDNRGSIVGMDISEPYAPPHHKASTRPIRDVNSTNQTTATGVDTFRPGSWRLRHNVAPSGQIAAPGERARGNNRESAGSIYVGLHISEPFHPAPARPNDMPPNAGADDMKVPLPASTPPSIAPPRGNPAWDRPRQSGMGFVRSTSTRSYPSIVSSFASNVSLNDLRAPSMHPSLVPSPLRTSDPEHSVYKVPRPHPQSIYGTVGFSSGVTAGWSTNISPPGTPNLDEYGPSKRDASPPSSPELDKDDFEWTPPGTPIMQSRPVTTWSGFYDN